MPYQTNLNGQLVFVPINAQQQRQNENPFTPVDPADEQSWLEKIGHKAMSGLGYLGQSLDKMFGGRAIRGILGGNLREAASIIPFSDSLGITNENDITYGRDLLQKAGILGENTPGLDAGDIGGFLTELALDPATYINPFGAFTKAGKAVSKVKSLSHIPGSELAKGAQYSAEQLRSIPGVASGAVKAEDLIPRGSLVLPEGIQAVPRYSREAQAGVDLPIGRSSGPPRAEDFSPPTTLAGAKGRVEGGGLHQPGRTYYDAPNPDELRRLRFGEAPGDVALQTQRLADVPSAASTPLYGAFGIGLPFGETHVFGTGPTAQKYMQWLEWAGNGIKGLAPIRYARALFSKPADRALEFSTQEIASTFKDPLRQGLEQQVARDAIGFRDQYEKLGLAGRDQQEVGRLLSLHAESLPAPRTPAEYAVDLQLRDRSKYEALNKSGGLQDINDILGQGVPGPLGGIDVTPGAAERLGKSIGEKARSYRPSEVGLGLKTGEYQGIGEYMIRQLERQPWETGAGGGVRGKVTQTAHASQEARKDIFEGYGTTPFNDIVSLGRPLTPAELIERQASLGASHADLPATRPLVTGPDRALTELQVQGLLRRERLKKPWDPRLDYRDPASLTGLPGPAWLESEITPLRQKLEAARQANDLQKFEKLKPQVSALEAQRDAVNEQVKNLSKHLAGLDPRYATEGRNYFSNDVIGNLLERGKRSATTQAGAQAAYETVARLHTPLENTGPLAKPIEGLTPVKDFLKNAGLDEEIANNLAAKALGQPGVDLNTLGIPTRDANDALRITQPWRAPEEIAAPLAKYDAVLNLVKTWLTRPFIGFHTRNLASGEYNILGRDAARGGGGWTDAQKLLRGRTDIGDVPGITDGLRGLDRADAVLREAAAYPAVMGGGRYRNTGDVLAGDLAALSTPIEGRVRLSPERLGERLRTAAVDPLARDPAIDAATKKFIEEHHYPGGTLTASAPTPIVGTPVEEILRRSGLDTVAGRKAIEERMGRPLAGLVVPDAKLADVVGKTGGESISDFGGGFKGSLKDYAKVWSVPGVVDNPVNPLIRQANVLGDTIEQQMRLQHFIEKVRQGYSPQQAAAAVEKYHFDYSNLTGFEKNVMKRLIPFYAFSRKNIAAIAEDLVTKPAALAGSIRGSTSANRPGEFIPPYLSEQTALPIGGAPEGFQRFISSFGLPYEDELLKSLGSFAGGDVSRGLGNLGGQLSPALKYPIEGMTGVQLSTGRKLEDLRAGAVPSLLSGFNEDKAGMLSQLISATPASRAVSTVDKILDERKGVPEKLINLLTGARLTDVDIEKQKEVTARQYIEKQFKGTPGARTLERLYVKPEYIPQLTEDQFQLMRLYRQLERDAQQRARLQKQP